MSFTSGQILTASQLNVFTPGTKIKNANGSASDPTYTFDGDANTGMFRSGTDALGFSTGGTQVVTISSDGRLGVGDTSPSATLHVNAATANTTAVFESTDAEAYIGLKDNSSGSDLHVAVAAISNDLVLRAGNSNAVRVKDDGDVGIGTTSPDARLHVNSGTTDVGLVVESSDAGVILGLKDNSTSSTSHVGIRASGNDLTLRAGDANQVTVFSGGTAQFAGAVLTADGSASSPAVSFGNDSNTGLFSSAADQLGLATGGSERVTITGTEMIPNVDLRPSADGTIELGTSTYRWQAVHSDRYYLADTDSYIQFDADSGAGIDGPGFRFVINGSEMFKFQRENNDSNHSMLTFGENNDGILYEKDNEKFNFYRNGSQVFEIEESVYVKTSNATFLAADPATGTGNDAEWAAPLGIYILRRNSSLAAEKENITDDLGEHLTADMIDSVVPKMWNRLNAPGYPEIGPIAEDMDAISPFLAARGTTAENVPFLTGINKTAYLSLLVLAVKDLRTRVAALESA